MASELGPEEREAELARLRKQIRKSGRRGDRAEYDRLSAVYARQKAEHVEAVHEEHIAERRAVRAALRAREERERAKPWRLPRGFGTSPLAAQRARGIGVPREEPVRPAYGLRPWRRGPLMSERIWKP